MRITALALGAAFCVIVLGAGPALAHDEIGVMVGEYVADPPDSPDGTYRVRLTYANDGHAAEGANVSLTAVSDAGATVSPTPMTPVDPGEYEAAVSFPSPGLWTVVVSATGPNGTFSQALTIAEPAEDPEFEDNATEEVMDEPIAGSVDTDDDDGGGLGAGFFIGIAATLIAAAVAAVVIYHRRTPAA